MTIVKGSYYVLQVVDIVCSSLQLQYSSYLSMPIKHMNRKTMYAFFHHHCPMSTDAIMKRNHMKGYQTVASVRF